jgi:hypothetical protein
MFFIGNENETDLLNWKDSLKYLFKNLFCNINL